MMIVRSVRSAKFKRRTTRTTPISASLHCPMEPKRCYSLSPSLETRVESEIQKLLKVQTGVKKSFAEGMLSKHYQDISPRHIFPTTRSINLRYMDYIGFDYDYTLANYRPELMETTIYNSARDRLVNKFRYPSGIQELKYDPEFPTRGLYYDRKKGNILKLDYLQNIQYDAVYFGRKQLTEKQVRECYGAFHIGKSYFHNLRSMNDNFSLAEVCLIADTIEYFRSHGMDFDPTYVYEDVVKCISYIHTSGIIHNKVVANLPKYLVEKRPDIGNWLSKLKRKNKKLFLLTNNIYDNVNAGMSFLLNDLDPSFPDWKDYFDIIVVKADKPTWFTSTRPFREYDYERGNELWKKVNKLEKNKVYVEGSMQEFERITSCIGESVLYIGDHLFSDLREPQRTSGWRTAVLISELEKEIKCQSDPKYKKNLEDLLRAKDLRRKLDMLTKDKNNATLLELREEITRLHRELKEPLNKYFGSVFRTPTNATMFAYYLQRYADLYTSSVENFAYYPHDFKFASERSFLPHEKKITEGTYPLDDHSE
eukprot:TRINITY_DN818_c0_g1_i1.p1 TRINITY_DN818_c0_g1~~TRINITY_DN818_c0_g1_i1.p1  ORF type:complete len:537 (+),score=91.78 TRINITY_DN818_c0_g1_i1:82-1692(+)